jgi:hypothetical protein
MQLLKIPHKEAWYDHRIAEASELGLPPGVFPRQVQLMYEPGEPVYNFWFVARDESRVYTHGEKRFTILND